MIEEGRLVVPHTLYYSLLIPESDTPRPPLLMALHGFGQSAPEMADILKPVREKGILVAVPQAPHHFYVSRRNRKVGFTWLTKFERDRTMQDVVVYLDRFLGEVGKKHSFDPERVYVFGFSQGVSIAYRYWQLSGRPLAGLIACGSDLPPDVTERLSLQRRLPIRLQHGRDDPYVPLQEAHSARSHLKQHGYEVELTVYDGGHSISRQMLDDLSHFILSK